MELNKKIILILVGILIIPIASAQVVINEIMYNPNDTSQCSDSYCEWVEIYNDGAEKDLTNWTLCGSPLSAGYIDNADSQLKLNTTMILPPESYAIITDGPASGTKVYSKFNVDASALALHINVSEMCDNGLNNVDGDTIILIDANNGTEDSVIYQNIALGGYSIELAEGSNQHQSTDLGGSPGRQNKPLIEDDEQQNESLDDEDNLPAEPENQTPEEIEDVEIKIISALEQVCRGESFEIQVEIKNNFNVSKDFEVYSYVYEGHVLATEGGWSGNIQELSLPAGESEEIELENAVKADANISIYTLKARAKTDNRTFDDSKEIKVIKCNETTSSEQPEADEPENFLETDEEITYEASNLSISKTAGAAIWTSKGNASLITALLLFSGSLVVLVAALVVSRK